MTRLLAALALVLSTGCVSVVSTVAEPKPYGGVRLGAAILGDGSATLGGVPVLVALDLPFSAVLDTLLLPYTLSYRRGSAAPACRREGLPAPDRFRRSCSEVSVFA